MLLQLAYSDGVILNTSWWTTVITVISCKRLVAVIIEVRGVVHSRLGVSGLHICGLVAAGGHSRLGMSGLRVGWLVTGVRRGLEMDGEYVGGLIAGVHRQLGVLTLHCW